VKVFLIVFCITSVVFILACASSPISVNKKSAVKSTAALSTHFQQQFLLAINQVRSKARKCGQRFYPAAPALSLSKNLNQAAYQHSRDMYENQFLEHTSSNGDTLVERMQNVNYAWRAVAENIAHNQKSISQVIEDWLTSPGHCGNIMSSDYTQTGVAQVNKYWTQVYAAPK
jgi:uncharacterized protein YkwD